MHRSRFRRYVVISLCVCILSLFVLTPVSDTFCWSSANQTAVNELLVTPALHPVTLLKYEKLEDGTLTETPLPDAYFYLYYENGSQYGGRFRTDELGKIITQLPPGSYYFEEVQPPPGMTYDQENGTPKKRYPFTVPADGTEDVVVTAYNIRQNGSLSLTKILQNADESELTPEQLEQKFTFTVTFSDGGTYSYSVDGGQPVQLESGGTLTLQHGQTAVFVDIPLGVTYHIEEKLPAGFRFEAEGHTGCIHEEISKAVFTNIYTPELNSQLEVTKEVVGEGADPNKEFTFHAVINGKEYTFVLKHGESKIFEDFPANTDYIVWEQDETGSGYVPKVGSMSGTLVGGKVVLPFVNVYHSTEIPPGSLTIEKEVIGEAPEAEFSFQVTFSDGGTYSCSINGGDPFPVASGDTIKLKAGQSAVFPELPDGITYEITETDSGGLLPDLTKLNGVIVSENNSVAHFVNRVESAPALGSLLITKEVIGEGADPNQEFTFHAIIGGVEYTFVLKNGESKQFDGLMIGTDFVVTENALNLDGWFTDTSSFQGVINDSLVRVPFVNRYVKPILPGSLAIEKEVAGDEPNLEAKFPFQVVFSDGGTYSCSIDGGEPFPVANGDIIELSHGQTARFPDLPEGLGYTVREMDSGDYVPAFKEIQGVIIQGQNSLVHFTNTPVPPVENGSLSVTKEVIGEGADLNKEFEFTAVIGGETYTFVLKHGETKLFEQLPVGTEYVVTEKVYTEDGYLAHVQQYTGVVGKEQTVLPFRNQYIPEVPQFGDLAVEKEVVGPNADPEKEFTFIITFSDGGTYDCSIDGGEPFPVASGSTIRLRHGQTALFKGLPAGTEYHVEETDASGYLPLVTVQDGKIVAGVTSKVHFINNTTPPAPAGSLTVTKEVVGDGADLNKEFEFTIELNGELITFPLKHGDQKVFEKLPIGTKFVVTEKSYDEEGYLTQVKRYEGTINGLNQIIRFVNVFQKPLNLGSLRIEKELIGQDTNPPRQFTFQVEFSDGGTYSCSINGGEPFPVASGDTFQMSAGQSAVFPDLPADITYIVREVDCGDTAPDFTELKGTILAGETALVHFINRVSETPATLRITKVLEGNYPPEELEREFEFIFTINGQKHTVTLKPGQSLDIQVPDGTQYEVVEKDYSAEGYTTVIHHGSGIVYGGQLVEIEAINTFTSNGNTDIQGEKHWVVDDANRDKIPENIRVLLMHGDRLVEEAVVTPDENGKWYYEFHVPKYDENGELIPYTIVERPVEGFSTSYEGYDIINTYVPPAIVQLPSIEKQANGPEAVFRFLMRPEHAAPMPEDSVDGQKIVTITGSGKVDLGQINFSQPGEFTYRLTEMNDGLNGWTYDSAVYTLTITVTLENGVLVPRYTILCNGVPVDRIIFRNQYKEPPASILIISGIKTWDHGPNPVDNRPKEILVSLYANGVLIQEKIVTENDEWKYSFEVPKFDENGVEIQYTITEKPIPGYECSVNGFDLFNKFRGEVPPTDPIPTEPETTAPIVPPTESVPAEPTTEPETTESEPTEPEPIEPEPVEPPTSKPPRPPRPTKPGEGPQTGDPFHIQNWMLSTILSLIGFVILMWNYFRTRYVPKYLYRMRYNPKHLRKRR